MKHTSKLLVLLVVALVLPNGACNDPLRVSIPTIVPPGSLSDTAALGTLRAGAIGDFSIAFSGDHPDGSGGTGEGVIMYGGLLADEWIDSETFPTRIEVDARTIQVTNADVDLWYRLLHQARNATEKTAAQYAALVPNDAGHAEVLNLAGYTYLFFAETFCSGVPVSHLDPVTGKITYGVPLTSRQLIDTAVARFNAALTVSAAVTNATLRQAMTNLASVGKARALVDSGDFAGAATAVSTVPTSFAYLSEHSEISTSENNGVFNGNTFDRRYSVADREGVNGFPFRFVADKRTPVRRRTAGSGNGFDGLTPQYNNFRFGDAKSPIPLATGVEARLIEAEAGLRLGDTISNTGAFYNALNNPRDSTANRAYFNPSPFSRTDTLTNPVPALATLTTTDATAAGGAVNLLFAERARWLWLTAHRLGDLRRLIRQYGRAANTVFPTGAYFKSNPSAYGVDVNIPVPITEQNNPNFTACLDRLP
jgi:hypothetical protein